MKRTERDFLGELEIDNLYYYGIQTLRAVENFPILNKSLSEYPIFINSLAEIKKAAAISNCHLGFLDSNIRDAIVKACDLIIEGKYHDQFVVPMLQGGAGTSTNMNINEVVANLALEFLGHKKGQYEFCHPNDHVNLSQSTNDVYPTAIKITLYKRLQMLANSMHYLSLAFKKKGEEFKDVLKMGRTQLQDAVPMTLGQEFNGFSLMLKKDAEVIEQNRHRFTVLNIGGTAIGTEINTPYGYKEMVEKILSEVVGAKLKTASDLIEATQSTGVFVELSGILKRHAVKLSKICNDLRLLSSGPRAGFNEINLPKMQPGSTIMPGKVNPVIPELVNQVAHLIIGNDITITMAAEGGQLQLNVFEPVIIMCLIDSISMLERANIVLADKCVNGITANKEVCKNFVFNSIGIVTFLNPHIGYENSTLIAKEAEKTGRSIYDITLEKGLISKERLDEILSAENMMKPFKNNKNNGKTN